MRQGTPRGGYWFSNAVLTSDLTPTCRFVAVVINSTADNASGRVRMSLSTIAKRSGYARSTVARALNELEEGGWIRRDRPLRWKAIQEHDMTVYTVVIPPGFPTKSSPTVGPPSPRNGLGLVPYAAKASPTVGHRSTDLTGGAAAAASAHPGTTGDPGATPERDAPSLPRNYGNPCDCPDRRGSVDGECIACGGAVA